MSLKSQKLDNNTAEFGKCSLNCPHFRIGIPAYCSFFKTPLYTRSAMNQFIAAWKPAKQCCFGTVKEDRTTVNMKKIIRSMNKKNIKPIEVDGKKYFLVMLTQKMIDELC